MKRLAICLSVCRCHGRLGGDGAREDGEAAETAAPAADDALVASGDEKAAPADGAAGEEGGAREREPATRPATSRSPRSKRTSRGPKAQRPTTTLSWQDIVVVPRKAFLKGGRLELAPFAGITVNDNLIRHYVFGVDLNYFLTDAFWVGLQGQYFVKQLTTQEELVGLQFNRIADAEPLPLRRRVQLRLRARLREVRLVQQVASSTGRSGRRPASARP